MALSGKTFSPVIVANIAMMSMLRSLTACRQKQTNRCTAKKLKPHYFPRSSLEWVVMLIQKWIYFGLSLEFVCFILCFVL